MGGTRTGAAFITVRRATENRRGDRHKERVKLLVRLPGSWSPGGADRSQKVNMDSKRYSWAKREGGDKGRRKKKRVRKRHKRGGGQQRPNKALSCEDKNHVRARGQ